MTTNEQFDEVNSLLDRLEARLDEMDKRLDRIIQVIDEYSKPTKIITTRNDGEIMFRDKK